jgi:hypothetical protein
MDALAAEEQSALKKNSTNRLLVKLLQAGMAGEEVFAMDRAALLNAVAISMRTPPKVEAKPVDIWYRELALREQELAFQRKQLETQRVAQQMQAEAQHAMLVAQRVDREAAETRCKLEMGAARERNNYSLTS